MIFTLNKKETKREIIERKIVILIVTTTIVTVLISPIFMFNTSEREDNITEITDIEESKTKKEDKYVQKSESTDIVKSEFIGQYILTDTSQVTEGDDEVREFSKTMLKEIKDRYQEFDTGVSLRKSIEYGNEYRFVAIVNISQETIDRLKYETLPKDNDYYLFSIADRYWIHPIMNENLSIPYIKGKKIEAPMLLEY